MCRFTPSNKDENRCSTCILDLCGRTTQSLFPTHISCISPLFISHLPAWPFVPSHSLWQGPWHYWWVHQMANRTAAWLNSSFLHLWTQEELAFPSQPCPSAESKGEGLLYYKCRKNLKERSGYGWLLFTLNPTLKEGLDIQRVSLMVKCSTPCGGLPYHTSSFKCSYS